MALVAGVGTTMAVVRFTFGAQPASVPPSVTKMNREGPLTVPVDVVMLTTKSFPPANTTPVGAECSPPAPGIVTTRGCGLPVPSYKVDFPVPLSDTQTGPFGLKATPHPLTRFGSVKSAGTLPSDTSTWLLYACGLKSPFLSSSRAPAVMAAET